MHIRAQVRAYLDSALGALTTPASINIEARRRLAPDDLPALVVSLANEEPQPERRAMGSPTYQVEKDLALAVEIHSRQPLGRTAADEIDAIEEELEGILAADLTFGGLIENIEPGPSQLESADESDHVVLLRSLNYVISYRHAFGQPGTPEA